jgi:hypothetical protein
MRGMVGFLKHHLLRVNKSLQATPVEARGTGDDGIKRCLRIDLFAGGKWLPTSAYVK